MNFNTFDTARSINPGVHSQSFTGTVNSNDPFDLYRFHINGRSAVQLVLTGLSSNANLEIIQDRNRNGTIDNSEILHRSTNESGIPDLLNVFLNPGTYFIRVVAQSGTTSYQLGARGTSVPTIDLVWRHSQSGENAFWAMESTVPVYGTPFRSLPDPNWKMVASTGIGDNRSRLVWRHSQSGENVVWLMGSHTHVASALALPTVSDPNWQIVASGDFNQDSLDDLVWRNAHSGENLIWLTNIPAVIGIANLPQLPDRAWEIVGAGDFDRNNSPDLVWRNRNSGENVVWLFNRTQVIGSAFLPSLVDRNWEIATVADLDLDRTTDLVWRHTVSGENAIWLMDGTTVKFGTSFTRLADPNWQIVAAKTNDLTNSLGGFDSAGNSLGAAFNLGILDRAATFQEFAVRDYDPEDFYQFALNEVTEVEVQMTGESVSQEMQLLDSNGNPLSVDFFRRNEGEVTQRVLLPPGTYFIQVFGGSNLSTYTLSIKPNPRPIVQYDFTYYYNGQNPGGDYYTGTVVAFDGTYEIGQFFDFTMSNNETGANGRYLITDRRTGGTLTDLNRVTLYSYYDWESNLFFAPDAENNRYGLGREVGWLRDRVDAQYFGGDFFEADWRSITSIQVGSSLRQGISAPIIWSDTIRENVKIELFRNGTRVGTIAEPTESDGRFDWTPMLNIAIAGDYQIRITSILDSTIFAVSTLFAITNPGTVRLTNPNGGNLLRPNSIYTITWTDDFNETVRLELWKGGTFHSTILTSTPSDGNEVWAIPGNLANGNDYELRIFSTRNTLVSDRSDAVFSVQADLKRYWFTYHYNPGNVLQADSYMGSVIAVDGSYIVNRTVDRDNRTTEAGVNGYYVITRIEDYDDRLTSDLGRVFVTDYVDRDNGTERRFTPRSQRLNQAAGLNYLGSELDFLDDAQSEEAKFGQDQIEADPIWVSFSNLAFTGREGDAGAVQVRLAFAPTSDVTIAFTGGNFLSIDADTTIDNGTQNSLTFTASNWNVARTIRFLAEQDGSASDRTSGNTISYSLSGNFTGSGTYNLGTITNTYAPDNRRFNIDLDFRNDYSGFWTSARRTIAQRAANDWAARIMNELGGYQLTNQSLRMFNGASATEFNFTSNRFIDDLVIFVGAYTTNDGWGGWGGIRIIGGTEPLPRAAMITVNTFFSSSYTDSVLYSLVSHEIGHALGLVGGTEAGRNLTNRTTAVFMGEFSRRANGGSYVRLQSGLGHPADEVRSIMSYGWSYQLSAPTEIDFAMLADHGYRISGINAVAGLVIPEQTSVSLSASEPSQDFVFACGCAKHLAAARLHTVGAAQLTDILGVSELV